MGKTFFVDWALWEKMVFVLACCIVVTILAGCLKLWYMHHQLRKYAKTPPKPINREKSIIRSLSVRKGPKQKKPSQIMVQKRRLMNQDGPNVPFGIRAIESGIEVDGVWISRSNTPAPSTREPSNNSLYKQVPQQSRQSSMLDVSMTLTNNGTETSPFDGSSTIASSSREPSQSLSLDRSFSGDSIGSHPPSSPEPSAQPVRRYPPHSYLRYEGSSAKHFRNSHTLEYRTPTGLPSERSVSRMSASGSSRAGSSGSNELPSPYSDVTRPPQVRSISNPAFDDALQTHRMSQVAETGHLVPRSRRLNVSTDWAAPIVSGEVHNFSLPRMQTPPPPGSSSSNNSLNPFATPTSDKPVDVEFPSEQKTVTSEPKSRRSSSFSRTNPDSSVLREVNSGFAVLKPGTLESEALARETAQQHARSRSGSFDGGERRHSRKLQKKRRPSESSRESQSSFEAGSDLERGVKYSFDQNPPSERDVERGAQVEASGAKYKF